MVGWEKALESPDYNFVDKKLFLGFVQAVQTGELRVGDSRVGKYLSNLGSIHDITGMSLADMVKDEDGLRKAIAKLNTPALSNRDKPYGFGTIKEFKCLLGRLYTFKHENDPSLKFAPAAIRRLISHKLKANDNPPERVVILREEMREMLQYGNTLDRAIVSLLFDTGARIGEFVQLKKSDITPCKEGLMIHVPKHKTKERTVCVVESKTYINEWLQQHPSKSSDDLWVSPETIKPLCSAAIAKRIRLVIERMNAERQRKGIPKFVKKHSPKEFRHARATEFGGQPFATESILDAYFGWRKPGMSKVYLHGVDQEKLKRVTLASYGQAKLETTKIETAWVCRRCKESVPIAYPNCPKCTAPRDTDKEIVRTAALEQRVKALEAVLNELGDITDPEVVKESLARHKKLASKS